MAGKGPSILVVAGDWNERVLIASTLREAGFAAVAAAEERGALAALRREPFAAAVIALADADGIEFLHHLKGRQPGLPVLLVLDPAAMRLVDEDCATVLKRPCDPRQLLGCVFELVLREEEGHGDATRHSHAAELGIAAARLACLTSRRATATAAGASRLTQELTRQISEMTAVHRGLAETIAGDRPVVNGWVGAA